MSSEIIVVLVLVALAIGFLVWLEMHSRRNTAKAENEEHSTEPAEAEARKTTVSGSGRR
jgi:flagellar basal body-associated protein FliL